MEAVRIGAFVISAPRAYAGIALLVMIVAAEIMQLTRQRAAKRRAEQRRAAGDDVPEAVTDVADAGAGTAWAWNAAVAVLVGSRLGFVLENAGFFLQDPLAALRFWQGGFSPWWGVAAGAAVTVWGFRRSWPRLVTALAPSLLGLGVWLVLPLALSPADAVAQRLPSLAFERLEGGALDLSELEGQPVIVNLWATWCPPCRRELPLFAEAATAFPDVHFVFANQGESRDVVADYLAERDDLALANVILDRDQALGERFGSLGLPTTYFFDGEGWHVLTHVGEVSTVALINYLADLRAAASP
jgi:thiol-disulfide isomerase/thioredoxin